MRCDIVLGGTSGSSKKINLGGNLTTLNNNVTINADTSDRVITLKSDLTIDQSIDKTATPEFNGVVLSGALTSVDNNTPITVSLKEDKTNAASFSSQNMTKMLSFDTSTSKEKINSNAIVDISTVTEGFNLDGTTPIFATHIHPTSVTIDGSSPSVVSSVAIEQPNLQLHSGAEVQIASSLYIKDAPLEGVNNYGLYINAASNKIVGDLSVDTINIGGVNLPSSSVNVINSLASLTASADDLNLLSGTTVTSTEFNHIKGITGNIQTQLDSRLTQEQADTIYLKASGTAASFDSGTTVGTLTFSDGQITDSGGSMSFGDNNLLGITNIDAGKLVLSDKLSTASSATVKTTLSVGGTAKISGATNFANTVKINSTLSVGSKAYVSDNLGANAIGIGTDEPTHKLSIDTSNHGAKISLYDEGISDNIYGLGTSSNQLNYHVVGTQDNHVFYAGGNNGDGTELMKITGDGKVGINKTNPQFTLDVGGSMSSTSVRTSGDLTVFGAANITGDITTSGSLIIYR